MGRATAGVAAVLAVGLAGCPDGTLGTVEVTLVTPPGDVQLMTVTRLRVTLTSPRQVVEATRSADGFDLALEVDADGTAGAIVVEGFDSSGTLIVTGASPPFVSAARDAMIVVFVAAPLSIAEAPVSLGPERSGVSATSLGYGALLAGDGAVHVYNAYDHSLLPGLAMPEPRRGPVLAATPDGAVYMFGGLDGAGAPTGTLTLFDTRVAPSGAYSGLGEFPQLARAGERAVAVGQNRFLITGDPAVELALNTLTARPELGALPRAAASVTTPRGAIVALFAGPGGIARFKDSALEILDPTPRSDAAVVALSAGRFAVLDGVTREVILVDADTAARTTVPLALSRPRVGLVAAGTNRHVVITSAGDATADILDGVSGALVATLAVTPRTGGFAVALPNDQVLLGGGEAPSTRLELFTPPPPP